ncbi:Galactosyl T domain containing protein, partial [Asbolus verrucosus]
MWLIYVNIDFNTTPREHLTSKEVVKEIEGWGVDSIRDPNHYIKLKSRIVPKDFCHQKSFLLVMVHSAPFHSRSRHSIRKSWAKSEITSIYNVSVYFLLGLTQNISLQNEIEEESAIFGDIIQEGFVDNYNNLTLKSLMMLKLVNSHCKSSVTNFLKSDDDSYVNLGVIVEMLVKRRGQNLLIGGDQDTRSVNRNPLKRWYVPPYLYSETQYPDYLCGAAYLMSIDVVQKLYEAALTTTLFYIEDVYVTGICAEKAGVPRQHTPLVVLLEARGIDRSFLLVMVHSAPSNSKNRTAIRKSWGRSEKTSKHNASVYFLLGLTSDSNLQVNSPEPILKKEIDAENAEFGDIIQEGFVDSYNNLTLKSLMMLKLANLHCKRSVEYLLKVDDDSLVNIAVIVSTLVKEGDPELLMGSTKNNRKPNRNPSRKLYAPYYLYSDPSYPDYFSGGGYWMAMNVAKKLYKQALKTPLFYIEDVYITGICAERANILRQHTHMVILLLCFD